MAVAELLAEAVGIALRVVLEACVAGLVPVSHEVRSRAEAQLRAHRLRDGTGSDTFDGAHARILDLTEEGTALLVTPADRYFLFMFGADGPPYLRELAQDRARLVLGEKFRAFHDPA